MYNYYHQELERPEHSSGRVEHTTVGWRDDDDDDEEEDDGYKENQLIMQPPTPKYNILASS